MKEMERKHLLYCVSIIGDYCWMLNRTEPEVSYKRKAIKRGMGEGKECQF